jgi:hypothetical protein
MRILMVEPITPEQTLEQVLRIAPAVALRFTPRSNDESKSALAPSSMNKTSPSREMRPEEVESSTDHLVNVWA